MNKKKSEKKTIKIIVIFLFVVVVIGIIILGIGFLFVQNKMSKMNKVEINEEEISVSNNENLVEYRNIAIFGVDSRSDDYGTGNRSDCIMIASINNTTHDVKLVSVYRDSFLQIEGYGLDKVTHAYSYGEAPLAIKTLNENLDLNITEFVTVNFDVVSDAVDALGGIEMHITDEEAYHINGYINETSKVTGKKTENIYKGGTYILDGVQAVSYCRIRYTAGGDYKRTERMRDVITAMLSKLKTKSISEINKIIDELLPQVYTNLSISDLISILPALAEFNISDSSGWPNEIEGATIGGVWYGVPNTLEKNVELLHKNVFNSEEYEVPENVKNISNKIISVTGVNNYNY